MVLISAKKDIEERVRHSPCGLQIDQQHTTQRFNPWRCKCRTTNQFCKFYTEVDKEMECPPTILKIGIFQFKIGIFQFE